MTRHHSLDKTPPSLAQAIPCPRQHLAPFLLELEALMTAAASSLWAGTGMRKAQTDDTP